MLRPWYLPVSEISLQNGGLEGDALGGEDGELLGEVELEDLVRQANSLRAGSGLSGVVRDGGGFLLVARVFWGVVGDFFALRQNAPTQRDVLIVEFAHSL